MQKAAAESVEAVTAGVDKTQTLLDEAERAAIAAAESVSALRDFAYEKAGEGGGYLPFQRGEEGSAALHEPERGTGQWRSWRKKSWFDSEISPDGDSVVAWIGKGSAAFETGDVEGRGQWLYRQAGSQARFQVFVLQGNLG